MTTQSRQRSTAPRLLLEQTRYSLKGYAELANDFATKTATPNE